LINSGAFSLLFSHLKIEHNIVLRDSTKGYSELKRRKENYDNDEQLSNENPVGIQIMKLKLKEEESDVEEFKDDLYFEGDDPELSQELTYDQLPDLEKDQDEDRLPCIQCNKTFTSKNTLKRHLRKIHGIYTKPKEKKSEETQDPFVKHDHFTQVGEKLEEADMVCKYCSSCKLKILVNSGAFSILFSHLKIEHDIIIRSSLKEYETDRYGDKEESDNRSKEKSSLDPVNNEEPIDESDLDPSSIMEYSDKPVGVQIMKLKEEDYSDVEEFKDDLYFDDDETNNEEDADDNEENLKKEHLHRIQTDPGEVNTSRKKSVNFDKKKHLRSHPKHRDPADEERIPCTHCDKTFTLKKTLHRHLLKVHGFDRKKKGKKSEEETEAEFVKHEHFTQVGEKLDEADMVCKYCGETYSNKTLSRSNWNRRLKKHLYDVHQDKLSFQLVNYLTNQMERERLRKQEYNLINRDKIAESYRKRAYGLDPETGKVVRFRAKIENYNRQFHKCTYEGCTKDFISASRLRDHIRTHTGERPYQCTTCGKSFTKHSYLNNHLVSHSDEAKYVCNFCGNRYKYAGGLEKHIKEGKGCSAQKLAVPFI